MILKCKIKHNQNFNLELAKAKHVAIGAKKNQNSIIQGCKTYRPTSSHISSNP